MDSVSQFVLGAAVAGVALGARTSAWRALLWGGVIATLPDLDVLIDHGDPVQNMTRHRAESHALLWLTVVSPLFAVGIAALHRELALFRRWWLAVWLALVTHPLLDAMTIYGTQLLLPFTDHPFAIGSLFVVDPLYTLPLLVGNLVLLGSRGSARGRRANVLGLVLSSLYAGASVGMQQWARAVATASLTAQGFVAKSLVVTPAPLQTVLWRAVAIDGDRVLEAFWSPFDDFPLQWQSIARGEALLQAGAGIVALDRLLWFSQGCSKAERDGDRLRVTDLRMGQEPYYVFVHEVASFTGDGTLQPLLPPVRLGNRIEFGRALGWLWTRMWGAAVPTPR
ncbi:MAG: metal-dependent hydrolase [Planctomycetes bacterium]|nr:metal-dependent hydrolase [Planctomycetota bacterium]